MYGKKTTSLKNGPFQKRPFHVLRFHCLGCHLRSTQAKVNILKDLDDDVLQYNQQVWEKKVQEYSKDNLL